MFITSRPVSPEDRVSRKGMCIIPHFSKLHTGFDTSRQSLLSTHSAKLYISNYKNDGKTIYFLICDKTVFVVFGFISIFKLSTLLKLEMFIASSLRATEENVRKRNSLAHPPYHEYSHRS